MIWTVGYQADLYFTPKNFRVQLGDQLVSQHRAAYPTSNQDDARFHLCCLRADKNSLQRT
jgi:hypothetical protein